MNPPPRFSEFRVCSDFGISSFEFRILAPPIHGLLHHSVVFPTFDDDWLERGLHGAIVPDKVAVDAAMGDIAQQQTGVVAVEDGAIAHLKAAALFQDERGGLTANTVNMQAAECTIGALSKNEAMFWRFLLPQLVSRVALEVVATHHDVAARLDQHVLIEALPERVAADNDATRVQ